MDNITNKATGLTKEMLNMTYPDKYYQNVINPAKTGTGPIPSKTQMMYQNLKSGGPFKAMRIGMDPYLPSFMGGGKYNAERAMPTGPAKAALGGFGTAARTAFSLPMTAGALAQQGLYSLNKPSTPAGFNYAQNLDRNSISSKSVQIEDPFFPTTIAVPVSWHIGKIPPAATFAFFNKVKATYLSLSDASESSSIVDICFKWPALKKCEI